MVSDKKIHRAFRTHTILTKQIREIFIFTIYQNYTLALILFKTPYDVLQMCHTTFKDIHLDRNFKLAAN